MDNDCGISLAELGSITNQDTECIDDDNFAVHIDLTQPDIRKPIPIPGYNEGEMVKAETAFPTSKSDLAEFNFYGTSLDSNLYDTPDNMFDDAFSLDEFMLGNQMKSVPGNTKWEQQKIAFQTGESTRTYTRIVACEPVDGINGDQDFLRSILNEQETKTLPELQPFVNPIQRAIQPSSYEIRNRTFSDLLRGDGAGMDGNVSTNFPSCANMARSRDYSVSSDSGVGSSILMESITSPSNPSSGRSTSSSGDGSPPNILAFDRKLSESVAKSAIENDRFPSHVSDLSRQGEEINDDFLLAESSLNGQIPGVEDKVSSKKTAYNEKWGVKVFKAWCVDMSIDEDFERLTPEQLNDLLCRFWSEVRKSNGDYYGRNSLFNLRAMINKHLKGKPYSADFDIVTDERFRSSNDTLEKQLKILKGIGKTITHKQPISIADLRKMYDSNVLGTGNPLALLRKVWFEITLHFCHKGSEPQEKLTRTSFQVFRDHNYRAYISRCPGSKSGNDTDEIRMYETGGELCPVQSYQAYCQKLHPLQGRLFQQPRRKSTPTSPMWYGKAPIGEKALQQMMANISVAAKLSKRYTNHCVRTTALEQFCTSRKKSGCKSGDKSQKSGRSNTAALKKVNQRHNSTHQITQNNIYAQPTQAGYKPRQHLTYGPPTEQPHHATGPCQYAMGTDIINPYENIPDQNEVHGSSLIKQSPIKSHGIRDNIPNGMSRCYKRTYEEITINHPRQANMHQSPVYPHQPTKRARLDNCHVFLSRNGARGAGISTPFVQNLNNIDNFGHEYQQQYLSNMHPMTSHHEVTSSMMGMISPRKGLSETIIAGDSNIPELKSISNQNFTVLTNIV